jgi:translation initiation factor IF-2
MDNIKEEEKKEFADESVFPCVLEIIPNCIYNKKDPVVFGVDILEGISKVPFFIYDDSNFMCIRLYCLPWWVNSRVVF